MPLTKNGVQSALGACFALLDTERDSSSDIGYAILEATDNLGRKDGAPEDKYAKCVGKIRASAGIEQIAELQMYIRRLDESRSLRRRVAVGSSHRSKGTIESAMMLDENQLAILTFLESIGDEVMPYARGIIEGTGLDPQLVADEIVLLEQAGLIFAARPQGWTVQQGRFRLDDGGRAVLAELRKAKRETQLREAAPMEVPATDIDPRLVFVVHGLDMAFASAMNDFLRSLNLMPLEWGRAVALTKKPTPYINEVLQAALQVAQGVVILLTPDNEGRLREGLCSRNEPDDEKSTRFHPRQNVIYEAGLAFGMAQDRTIIVRAGPVLITSDLHGLNYVTFTGDAGSRARLAQRLSIAGCAVDTLSEAWLTSGAFPAYDDLVAQMPQRVEPPARTEGEVGERAFMVQPRLHVALHSGSSDTSGHYITGIIRNIGRGTAFEATLKLPGLGLVALDRVIKPTETLERKLRYDDTPPFTAQLADLTVRAAFQDELGNLYEQEGEAEQALTPGGAIFSYAVRGLDRPKLTKEAQDD